MNKLLTFFILHFSFLIALTKGEGFSEVPLLLYGKVLNVNTGTSHQLFEGELVITLVSEETATNSVELRTSMKPQGPGETFSYAIEIPQQYLPQGEELTEKIAVSSSGTTYRLSQVTVDGFSAVPLDREQSLLSTSFATRGQEIRLDLQVTLDVIDTDSDGLPDWWEELYGFNPGYAGDATLDGDNDGWDNLGEFRNGTNPTISNNTPTVIAPTVSLPIGGKAGLHLVAYDTDTVAADLAITYGNHRLTGLTLHNISGEVTQGSSFSYEDLLSGEYYFESTAATIDGVIPFEVSDGDTITNFSLTIDVFSPGTQNISQPVVWLNAANSADDEWPDQSEGNRDGYQPTIANQPTAGSPVSFGEGKYYFLDNRDLNLHDFTALVSFRSDVFVDNDQTLLGGNAFDLFIGGNNDSGFAQALQVRENGRRLVGPVVQSAEIHSVSISRDDQLTLLHQVGGGLALSTSSDDSQPTSFFTIGARHEITESEANRFLNGGIYEVVLFPGLLDPALQARLEDYQDSRWGDQLIWDHSQSTVAVSLQGHPTFSNTLQGGWGSDDLVGSLNKDILRGGPGNDQLTGSGGADVFQFFANSGHDQINDFDYNEGDVIDLSALFARRIGSPEDYLNLRIEVVRQAMDSPSVDTILEINGAEQTVRLRNVTLSNNDLPWLIGGGHILLGGPRYDTSVVQSTTELNIVETEQARFFTVSRTGNIASELEVTLGFGGSATIGEDYTVSGTNGTGMVRTVRFARDQRSVQMALTPVQDTFPEDEDIQVTVYPSMWITDRSNSDLALTLNDAPAVSIESLVNHAQRLGKVAGVIKLTRSGDLSQPLDVRLAFDGTARNGEDFEQLAPLVSFAANEQSQLIEIIPADHALDKGQPRIVTVSVVPDSTRYVAYSPWTASVIILDKVGEGTKTFASWRADLPSQFNVDGALGGDGDFISLFTEYAYGLDPTVANNSADTAINVFTLDGRFVMEVPTHAGLTDIRIFPEALANTSWTNVTDLFDHQLYPLSDDRLMHVFTSRQAVSEFNGTGIYRLNFTPVTLPSTRSDLIDSSQRYLTSGTSSGWLPAPGGQGLAAAPRAAGESTILSTSMPGPGGIFFEWEVPAGSGATLVFEVDGATVATLNDGDAADSVDYSVVGEGSHQLKWILTYGSATNQTLSHHGLIKNVSY